MAVTDDEIKEPINAQSQMDVDMENIIFSNIHCFGDGFGGSNDNRSSSHSFSSIYHGEWPIKHCKWNSASGNCKNSSVEEVFSHDTASIISFSSSVTSSNIHFSASATDQINLKVETVPSFLTINQSNMHLEEKALYNAPEPKQNCVTPNHLRLGPQQVVLLGPNGTCDMESLPFSDFNDETNDRANKIGHKNAAAQPYDKNNNREMQILRLLVHIRKYCCRLLNLNKDNANSNIKYANQQVCSSVATLMKLSFDEEYRCIICKLGGLQTIAHLIQTDKEIYGCTSDQYCVMIRRYAGMALTNLTFNDGTNKSVLCSIKPFMKALVAQLHSPNEDLRQVTASVLRNLSWRADSTSKQMLRDVGAVKILMKAAMTATKESTLKSILSALWNLSAHCSSNKADICVIEGALAFLVTTLTYKSNSKTLTIVENAGGILRNISSHIAIQNDYRTVLRKHSCLQVLLCHLKSPSLTVVSNACGTLWNLSARNAVDQRTLWEMGAVGMLQKLVNSKHKMISMGSSAALKNLLSSKPPEYELQVNCKDCSSSSRTPSLIARKQKTFDSEVEEEISAVYDTSVTSKMLHVNQILNASSKSRYLTQSNRSLSELSNNILEKQISKISLNFKRGESLQCSARSNGNIGHAFFNKGKGRDVKGEKLNFPSPYTSNEIVLERKMLHLSRFCHSDNIRNPVMENHFSDNVLSKFEGESSKGNSCDKKKFINTEEAYPPTCCYSTLVRKFEKIDQDSYIEPQEQPINYSLKYTDETSKALPDKSFSNSNVRYAVNREIPQPKPAASLVQKADSLFKHASSCEIELPKPAKIGFAHDKNVPKGLSLQREFLYDKYIETDLDNLDQPIDFSKKYFTDLDNLDDQPVDFSKKFQEQDVSEECPQEAEDQTFLSNHASQRLSHGEDSIKVYCTEDTPLNFSSASSLTDLREIMINGEAINSYSKNKSKNLLDFELCTTKTSECNEETDEICCDMLSPVQETNSPKDSSIIKLLPQKNLNCNEKEGKTVTFVAEVDYAEETPLMFSRCSSLGSLSSFEQQSIHDDRSSIISDFSRCTSGVVSPSELPDSPGHTVPPSPLRKKATFIFPPAETTDCCSKTLELPKKSVSGDVCHNSSAFDEIKKVFTEEGTPVQFSTISSLSSLSIENDSNHSKGSPIKSTSLNEESNCLKITVSPYRAEDNQSTNSEDNDNIKALSTESSDTEDSSDLLAECINFGLPSMNKALKNMQNESLLGRTSVHSVKLPCQLKGAASPIKSDTDTPNTKSPVYGHKQTNSDGGSSQAAMRCKSNVDDFEEDCIKVYRTEGTPNLSHSTSFSDLSILSFGDNKNKSKSEFNNSLEYHSDSSSVCDDDDGLLLQCIKSGMPSSKIPKKSPTQGSDESLHRNHLSVLSFNDLENKSERELNNSQEYHSDSSSVCDDDEDNGLLLHCIQSGMPASKRLNGFSSQASVISIIHGKQQNVPKFGDIEDKNESKYKKLQKFHSHNSYSVGDESNNTDTILNCVKSDMPHYKVCNKVPYQKINVERMHRNCTNVHAEIKTENKLDFRDSLEYHSDSCSVSDDDDNGLLMQCIKSGMPRSKKCNRMSGQVMNAAKVFISNSFEKKPTNSHSRPTFGVKEKLRKNFKVSDLSDVSNCLKGLVIHNQICSFPSSISYEQINGSHQVSKRRGTKHSTHESKFGSFPPTFAKEELDFQMENVCPSFPQGSLVCVSYDDDDDDEVFEVKRPLQDGVHSKNKDNACQTSRRGNVTQVGNSYLHHKSEFEIPQCPTSSFDASPETIMKPQDCSVEDHHKYNLVEGTPVCFSRCSSLSSLSVESFEEPSFTEKALLEECIRSGLPKGKILGTNIHKK